MRLDAPATGLAPARRSVTIAVVIAALLCMAQPLRWLDPLETRLVDLRFAIRGGRDPSDAIVIVKIDDETINRHPTLPTDAGLHAELIRRLTAAGAAVIGLDIPELARPAVDNLSGLGGQIQPYRELTAALGESGRVVLPVVWVRGEERPERGIASPVERSVVGEGVLLKPVDLQYPRILHPRADLCAAAAGLGVLNVHPDRDWTVRQAPLVMEAYGKLYPSLAVEMVRVASGKPVTAACDDEGVVVTVGPRRFRASVAGETPINFVGPAGTYPMLPYHEFVAGERLTDDLAAAVRGKLVLVGSTAVGEPARLRTPFSPYMAGVELTANALDTLISGQTLSCPRMGDGILLTLLAAAAAAGLALWLHPRHALPALVLLAAAVFGASAFAFTAGICLPTAGPLLAAISIGTLLASRRLAVLRSERRRQVERLRSRMGALAGVGRLLNSGLNREQLLTEIMVWVEEEIGCEATSLVLLNEAEGKLRFEVALGPKGQEMRDVEVEVGHGIVGTVVATGEPLVVPDPEADPRFAREIALAVGYPAKSILCVPMSVRGRVIGAIEVINKRDGTPFTENDAALLSVIGQQAAMFLETARLYGILEQRVDLANQELRLANQQLAAEKAKLEAIVHHMADGILAADEHGRIVLVNRAAEEMLGIAEERLFGARAAEALPNAELAALFAAPAEELPEEREFTVGDPVRRIVRARPALATDEEGVAGRVVVLNDITDLRELDRTKTDMVSFVSHELKTPLTAIKGFARLIRDRSSEATDREFAEVIDRQAERMYRLIGDFLNIARIDMGRELEMHWEWIADVRPIVEEAVASQPLAGPNHRFVVNVPEDLPRLRADPDKLYHVLLNLINNAVKYSPGGGTVEVSVQAEEGGAALHFAVRDEGIGIHPDNMQHLFKRFRRVANGSGERVEGTGLGLFLTRHLVQAHGGRVWAESEPGRGSTFHVVLPAEGKARHERSSEA